MGKLITVVGNSGVGKTTLTHLLCRAMPLIHGLEQHGERPFQALFAADLHVYALANQIDYLLLRAEQEVAIRQSSSIGIQDGGLDEDFFVFTRFFFKQGYLTADEYLICQRMYRLLRQTLPPPNLIIHLTAPLETIASRYQQRRRTLEIVTVDDLVDLAALLDDWIEQSPASAILHVDASADDPTFSACLPQLVAKIQRLLEIEGDDHPP